MAVAHSVEVRARGGERCEYCRMHDALQGATFHVEHVVPRCLGGSDEMENLAWACPSCNLHKSARTVARDPEIEAEVELFNPRLHVWREHFGFKKFEIIGWTAVGRSAIKLLHMNDARRVRIRQAELLFGLFPPQDQ